MNQDAIRSNYLSDGHCFPIEAMSAKQAENYRETFLRLEPEIDTSGARRGGQLNQSHVILQFVNEITRNPRILDAVEAVLGPNLLVWGSTFFIKEPRSTGFVSWHQDLHYWGLDKPDGMVSAWLALGPVTKENGCMQFVSGSQTLGDLPHEDFFDENNFLYRGQRAQTKIDPSRIVDVELKAGEFSLHHGYLLHASPANTSDIRRWGLTINYISADNRQIVSDEDYAMLVRGRDTGGNFKPVPAPEHDLSAAALELHGRVIDAKDKATFAGAAHA